MKVRLLLAGLATCSASLVASTAAQAMVAPPSCNPAALVPSSKQPIPVNLPGFGYTALAAKATDIHLFKVGSPGEVGLTVGPVEDGLLKVVPAPALAPGGSYRIEFASFCGYGATPEPGPFTFTTAPEAPLPTKLGDATSPLVVAVQDHGTSAFTVSGAFALDPAMQPWASIYKLSVVVDGTLVATKVTLSPAYDSATVTATGWCDAALASTTKHTLLLRARLPFAPPLDSAPFAADFACPAPSVTTLPNDPATAPAPGTATPTSSRSGGSGGCSTSPGGGGSPVAALGLALGLALIVRRRLSGAAAATRRT